MMQAQLSVIAASPGFVRTSTPDDGRVAQLEAGRNWLRLDLAAGLPLALASSH
jgi:hypothetical protein